MSNEHDRRDPRDGNPSDQLMLAEYRYFADAYWRNEELGESRIRIYLAIAVVLGTVVAGLLGHEAFADKKDYVNWFSMAAMAVLVVVGWVTFVRIIRRNVDSDRYRAGMALVKQYFIEKDPALLDHVYYDPYDPSGYRRMSWWGVGGGGWLETVALVNSIVTGAGAGLAVFLRSGSWEKMSLVAGIGSAVLIWSVQVLEANRRYDRIGIPKLTRVGNPPERNQKPEQAKQASTS